MAWSAVDATFPMICCSGDPTFRTGSAWGIQICIFDAAISPVLFSASFFLPLVVNQYPLASWLLTGEIPILGRPSLSPTQELTTEELASCLGHVNHMVNIKTVLTPVFSIL
jgi:hypothetical protein